jgi:hypothetical protein
MQQIITDTTNLIFESKDTIGDGLYIQLMSNMKQLYELRNVTPIKMVIPRTINGILEAWINNTPGSTRSCSFSTIDGNLYSYNLQIGYTQANMNKCVVIHTARGIGFVSATTSRHVGLAARYCVNNGIMMTAIDGN